MAAAPHEALGRVLAGAAPWLELGPGADAEGQLRARGTLGSRFNRFAARLTQTPPTT